MSNVPNKGTVLVEHSDERLAAVEEAKRTGQEFQSVGSKGAEIVEREAVVTATQEWSKDIYGDDESTLPNYLYSLKTGVEDEAQLNQRKAAEHNEVSDEITAAQNKAAVSDAEKLRQDPKYFSKRIQELNRKLAADHTETSTAYVENVIQDADGIAREILKIRAESIFDPNPATSLGKVAKDKVTDISEGAARSELEQKDKIIYGEDSFKAQAKAPRREAKAKDRAVKESMTNEPKRVEEPTRKAKPREDEGQQTARRDNNSDKKE
jgi:hypothetical protein